MTILRVGFKTTLDEQLVEQLKIDALKKKIGANDILEDLLKREFEVKCGAEKMLTHSGEAKDACKEISEELWEYHKKAYENENADRTDRLAASLYKNLYDNYLKKFWE